MLRVPLCITINVKDIHISDENLEDDAPVTHILQEKTYPLKKPNIFSGGLKKI